MCSTDVQKTKKGSLKKVSIYVIASLVKQAWMSIPIDIIVKLFKKYLIYLAIMWMLVRTILFTNALTKIRQFLSPIFMMNFRLYAFIKKIFQNVSYYFFNFFNFLRLESIFLKIKVIYTISDSKFVDKIFRIKYKKKS